MDLLSRLARNAGAFVRAAPPPAAPKVTHKVVVRRRGSARKQNVPTVQTVIPTVQTVIPTVQNVIPTVLAPIITYHLQRSSVADVLSTIKLYKILSDKDKASASYSVIAFGYLRKNPTQHVAIKAFPICIEQHSTEDEEMYIGGVARLLYEQTVYAYLTKYVPPYMKQHFVNFVMAGYSVDEEVAAKPYGNIDIARMRRLLLGGESLPWDDKQQELYESTFNLASEMMPPYQNGRVVGVAVTVTTLTRNSESLSTFGTHLLPRCLVTAVLHEDPDLVAKLCAMNILRSLLAQALIAVFVANRLGVEHHDMHGSNVLVAPAGPDVPPLEVALPSGLRFSVPRANMGIVTLFDWDSASCAACGPNTALNEFSCPMYGMCEGATERRDVFYLLHAFNLIFEDAKLQNPVPNMLSGKGVPYGDLIKNAYFCTPANGNLATRPNGHFPCGPYPAGEPRNVPDVLQLLHHPFFDPLRI